MWKSRSLWTDMSWVRFQLFCLTAQTSDVTSLSLSFLIWVMGPVLTVQLVVKIRDSIRVQHRAWCTDLTHKELREAMCMHTHYWAEEDRSFRRNVSKALGTQQEESESRMVSWESVFGLSWKDGQDIDRPWEERQFQMEEKWWRKVWASIVWLWNPALLCQSAHQLFQQSALSCFYC